MGRTPGRRKGVAETMKEWQSDFLKRVIPHALEMQRRYGVPASIALAQAILESNWGRSGLATNARNLFGMKRARRHPHSICLPTREYVEGHFLYRHQDFALYLSERESFEDWARLLAENPRYRPCLQHTSSPLAFADCIARAGYATDPLYAQKLGMVVREHGLDQYDRELVASKEERNENSESG